MVTHGLGRGPTELVSLATSSILRRLGLDCRRTRLHVCMDRVVVVLEVLENVILDRPLEEVELSYGRVQTHELDPLPTAEGVEHLFAIRLQVGLVGKIDNDMTGTHEVGDIVLLGVIGHKPVQKAQADLGLTREDALDLLEIILVGIEPLQAVQDPVIAVLNGLHLCS